MRSIITAAISLALLAGACSDNDETVYTLVNTDPALDAFATTVRFASDNNDLVDLLSTRPNTLTVFAPTDTAFSALAVELTGDPNAVFKDLLTPENKPLLRSIVQYHIVDTTVRAADIPFGFPIQTVEGSIFKVDAGTPPVITDGRNRTASFVQTNIDTSNGVVHKIDRVLLPPNMTVGQTVDSFASSGELTILAQAIAIAQLVGALDVTSPITVFAPTDAAFVSLLDELHARLPELLASPQFLADVLTYHVVPDELLAAQLPIDTPIETLQSGTITIDQNLVITDARGRTANIVQTDVFATNGVIHVIDRVLLPAP